MKYAVAVLVVLVAGRALVAEDATQRHALLVGVDYGTSQHLSYLRHPNEEVNTLADALPLVGYREEHVALLVSSSPRKTAKAPTVAALREALNNLTRGRGKDDVVLLAFSGHLIQWRDGECYLCGSDSRPNDKSTLVPLADVYAAFKGCQAGTRILLLDGCRKNAATQGGDVLQKIAHPQDVTPPRGVTVFFAASAGEASSERAEHSQGYFFQAVIEAVLGAHGLEHTGRVSVTDLERYVCRRVVSLSATESTKQTPEFTGTRRGEITRVPLDPRSGLGALFGPVDLKTKRDWNVPHGRPQVRFTVPGSSARRAGLETGTVVLEIDGTDIASVGDLVKVLAEKKIGDEIKVNVVSDGQRQTRTVKLHRLPSKAVWAAQVRQMAAEGNVEATHQVGQELLDGINVKRDYTEAHKWFVRAANKGHAGAQARVGYLYLNGLGVDRNYSTARDWLAKGAAQDNPEACVDLASLYYYGNGVLQSYADAYRHYRKAADQNNSIAQYNVGLMLLAGLGVSKDAKEGVNWVRLAANQGHTQAQLKMGDLYLRGEEVTKDATESNNWYRKGIEGLRVSADNGSSNSMVDLGNLYLNGHGVTRDDAEAVKWYRKAADAGNRIGYHNLGICYQFAYGVARDYTEAMSWYRKAADTGYVTSEFRLGHMYRDGLGVTKDNAEAVKWYRRAAAQGHEIAQVHLGVMCQRGEGQEKDEAQAFRLFKQSAEKGYGQGMFHLGTCYLDGSGTTKNVTEAINWYRKAIALGEVEAMNDLAAVYDNGTEVTKDATEAIRLYKMAAEKNYALSMCNLGNVYQHGRGVPVDKALAIFWYKKAAALGNVKAKDRLKELEGDVNKSAPNLLGD